MARKLGADQTFASGVYLPQRVDAVFDNVGAATRKHSMKNVRTGGTIVVSGATTGAKPEAMLRRVFVDSISVHGSYASTLQEFKSMLTFVTTRGIKSDRQRSPRWIRRKKVSAVSGKGRWLARSCSNDNR